MTVPKSHPRYLSLTTRDRLVEGWEKGLVVTQGLIAHGRGEAFDYLLGEVTVDEARKAERAAACRLLLAQRPVISVNGNVGALVPEEVSELSGLLECPVEVNIFHRTEERVSRLAAVLREHGCHKVLGEEPDAKLEGLDHARALCSSRGIFMADVVLVPLEDGDRCQALKAAGKDVITVDLNPLSRTSSTADITIVDNLIRAMPNLISEVKELREGLKAGSTSPEELKRTVGDFSNADNLKGVLRSISERFS
ncbi:MAG: 4-phosphopantoate--beta-alanine ligase [Thermoplasmatota archaeon]